MNRTWLITGANSGTKFALEGMSEALADEVRPLGIKVLIVEPGAFRTSLWTSSGMSAPTADYAATVGPTRHMVQTQDGTQAGDPAKAAAAILAAPDSDHPPLRLPLGEDAVQAIAGHLDSVRAEIADWEKVARDTQFPRVIEEIEEMEKKQTGSAEPGPIALPPGRCAYHSRHEVRHPLGIKRIFTTLVRQNLARM